MVEVNRVKDKEKFVPISIVLETKEEAEAMGLFLASPDNISFIEECQRMNVPYPEELIKKFCNAFHEVHSEGESTARY